MKSYSIGRDESSNIIINDPTQLVSRRHAILNVNGRKMTIVDSSSNGTYINGIRITPGVPVPVTRKDVISFAQVAELDWRCIPNESRRNMGIIAATIAAVLIVGGGTYYFLSRDKEQKETRQNNETVEWMKIEKRIDVMKKDVDDIVATHKLVKDTLNVLKKSLKTKDVTEAKASSTVESVKRIFWQVEESVKNVNPDSLKRSLDVVIQSYGDKVSSTESRVTELETKIKSDKEALESAQKLIKDAADTIRSLKTKSKPQPQKKPDNNNDGNTKDVIIVGM